MRWQGLPPATRIVALARSPNGTVAIATQDGESQSYWLVAADGTLEPLQPAPTQSFTPLVAWLDDSRLLVLTMDNEQVSRLAVVDISTRTITPSAALGGIRLFTLSPDRRSLAVATEASVYAGPVETFLETRQPATVASVDAAAVVWGLALDDSGTQLAMLSGTVAPDGLVNSVREIGYTKGAQSWTRGLDSPAPFDRAMDQVWRP
jgi:hypothetical protein